MTPWSETIRFTRPLEGARIVETDESVESQGVVSDLSEKIQLMPHELEAIRIEAFQEGERAGEEKAQAVYRSELSAKIEACEQLATGLEGLKNDLIKEMHSSVGSLVVEAVGRLLEGWEPGEADVRRIVEGLLEDFDPGGHKMRIRLNPDSYELLSEETIGELAQSHPQLEFVTDTRLQAGECVLEGRFGLADARYCEKIKSLNEVLTYE